MPDYPAKLRRVVDGDTIDFDITLRAEARVDVGFDTTLTAVASEDHWIRLRLTGLNAPEKNTPEGQDAITYVQAWFEQHPGPYTVTTLPGDRKEKYGRYLATLTAADGAVLNADLLASGHATPYNGTGPRT